MNVYLVRYRRSPDEYVQPRTMYIAAVTMEAALSGAEQVARDESVTAEILHVERIAELRAVFS